MRRQGQPGRLRMAAKTVQQVSLGFESLVNIVVKDQEKVLEQLSAFIQKLGSKLNKINEKKEVEGYLDVIRDLKASQLVLV